MRRLILRTDIPVAAATSLIGIALPGVMAGAAELGMALSRETDPNFG